MIRLALAIAAILAAHRLLSRTYAKETPKPAYVGLPGGFPRYVLNSPEFDPRRLN